MSVEGVIAIAAFILTIANAVGTAPLWVAVLLLALGELLRLI